MNQRVWTFIFWGDEVISWPVIGWNSIQDDPLESTGSVQERPNSKNCFTWLAFLFFKIRQKNSNLWQACQLEMTQKQTKPTNIAIKAVSPKLFAKILQPFLDYDPNQNIMRIRPQPLLVTSQLLMPPTWIVNPENSSSWNLSTRTVRRRHVVWPT